MAEYLFKFITEQDHPQILAHLEENFYGDEPVNKMLGTSKDRVADQNRRYTDMLQRYPKSLICTTRTNEVVAVLIVHIHDMNNPLPVFKPRSPITSDYLEFVNQAESKYNIFEQHNLSAFPELAILSVDKKHRGQGLATALYQRAMDQLFDEGFPLVYTEFSNPVSRKVGQHLGFQEVARFYFKEFKIENNSSRFSNATDEDFVSLMIAERKH